MTEAQTQEEHIGKLRQWVLFHSFILHFPHLCYFLEDGRLQRHKPVKRKPKKDAKDVIDDNIGDKVYFLHPNSPAISYKALFEQYQSFTMEQMSLLRSYLLPLNRHQAGMIYSLFDESRTYWQIAVYASVLEAIIGHASNCPGSVATCPVCNKQLQPHRQSSEKAWRESYLTSLIPDQIIRNEYLDVINTAYNEIRHPTAHAGVMPVPEYLLPEIGTTETYDIKRTIGEFPANWSALYSLLMSVEFVTRYLLLDKLFRLNTFPKLLPLNVTRIGGIQPSGHINFTSNQCSNPSALSYPPPFPYLLLYRLLAIID
ncbi:MAG: hypothetical protein ACJ8BW_15895 [Ktedonobacteraceae bacterium]